MDERLETMNKPKKLIEVAMPVKEISAESVRDKSIRHGHISTLHLWWARRPLPVCRAVVFASLVPDPLDDHCPQAFRDAVRILLGKQNDLPGDPYRPYIDIPHTAVVDQMEDHLRNRLLMFIGKFSDKYIQNEKLGKKTPAKDTLHPYSLIKWDNKNNEDIIGRARKLIFVSHNSDSGRSAEELLAEYDRLQRVIKEAEKKLYEYPDRHLDTDPKIRELEAAKDAAIQALLTKMPKVFDPFAGGGAIPLEAARLGCNSYGNDINPVAHIIQKGSCEFPQRFGKPIAYSVDEYSRIYGEGELDKQRTAGRVLGDTVQVDNRLSHDVEYFARLLLSRVQSEISQYYPVDPDGHQVIAYYWARVGTCANPSCGAKVPLLKQFYLSRKPGKYIHLHPFIEGTDIRFEIRKGKSEQEGWIKRGNMTCPCCHNSTDVKTLKSQFIEKATDEKIIAVILNGKIGKEYRLPHQNEIQVIQNIPETVEIPQEPMPVKYTQALPSCTWGLEKWGQMFTPRQLLALQTFVDQLDHLK